jgi:predicted RNA-binding protein with PIN domain
MRWLIDGYNVIRTDPDLRGAEARSLQAGRAGLLRLVAEAALRTGDPFTVVFDGTRIGSAPSPPGRVEVVFSRPPESADDVLRRLAGKHREGGIVVTSDRRIQDSARRAGCAALSADAFLSALTTPAATTEAGDDADDPEGPRTKRGNPRRRSRDERAIERALRRLGGQ